MKRFARMAAVLLCICICACTLSGCAKKQTPEMESSVLSVYATNYPLFAFTQMITANVPDVQLSCLTQPQDGCLRSYQISDWDYALLTRGASAIIAGGCGLESYESLLFALGESGPAVSFVLYGMDFVQINGKNTQPDSESHWLDPNPHVYMSFEGAMELLSRICETMKIFDPDHAEIYSTNLADAQNRLGSLRDECQTMVAFAEGMPVIVMNEALVYLPQTYNLEIELCYDRESGEEPEGNDLKACLSMLGSCDSRVVLIEKQAPAAFCKALEDAGFIVARLDVLSTRRADEGFDGYFAAQRENAYVLAEALKQAS